MPNWCHGVPIHLPLGCLFNSLLGLTPNKHQKFELFSLCGGNPLVTGGFITERDSNAESVSISWHHHVQIKMKQSHQYTRVTLKSEIPSAVKIRQRHQIVNTLEASAPTPDKWRWVPLKCRRVSPSLKMWCQTIKNKTNFLEWVMYLLCCLYLPWWTNRALMKFVF